MSWRAWGCWRRKPPRSPVARSNPDQRPRVPRRPGSLQSAYEGRGAHQVRATGSGSDRGDGEADIGDNEVLVKVHATTVNRTDCACRAAKPFFMKFFTGLGRPRATVLGNEFAGVVEAVGSGVTAYAVGDKVFGYNEGPFGTHAEYMSIPENGSLANMPANLTYEQAAPSTEGAH
jgi:D-arabinose 1-dehydrogenase-like Zn-dependent alcohol dehydrogenase